MSSALCSVAIEIVEPARNTGSSTAYGVTAPVRPTLTRDRRRTVVASAAAGNLKASAHRGNFGGRPQPLAEREVVHLDHDAVGVELERLALVLPRAAVREQRVDPGAPRPVRLHRQPPGAQRFERVRMPRPLALPGTTS